MAAYYGPRSERERYYDRRYKTHREARPFKATCPGAVGEAYYVIDGFQASVSQRNLDRVLKGFAGTSEDRHNCSTPAV
ncbi:hypothetical protein [Streptomyces sp. NPDC087300]|uniref:hypothetical protein n=1 Tax=Streptomyces sp. NPDC087300 TaxID=3365780 RepID=UPI003810F429